MMNKTVKKMLIETGLVLISYGIGYAVGKTITSLKYESPDDEEKKDDVDPFDEDEEEDFFEFRKDDSSESIKTAEDVLEHINNVIKPLIDEKPEEDADFQESVESLEREDILMKEFSDLKNDEDDSLKTDDATEKVKTTKS